MFSAKTWTRCHVKGDGKITGQPKFTWTTPEPPSFRWNFQLISLENPSRLLNFGNNTSNSSAKCTRSGQVGVEKVSWGECFWCLTGQVGVPLSGGSIHGWVSLWGCNFKFFPKGRFSGFLKNNGFLVVPILRTARLR